MGVLFDKSVRYLRKVKNHWSRPRALVKNSALLILRPDKHKKSVRTRKLYLCQVNLAVKIFTKLKFTL